MGKEQVYSCAEDIAMRLKEKRKYGEASLMVGAGFSKNAKSRGMKNIKPPDWGELADKMYCELYPKLPDMDEKQNKEWEKKPLKYMISILAVGKWRRCLHNVIKKIGGNSDMNQ